MQRCAMMLSLQETEVDAVQGHQERQGFRARATAGTDSAESLKSP
jgi:hypothetical protein